MPVRLTLADFLRHQLRPHRHPSRLRARRLRRLHHPVRRPFGALLPDARGAGRRPRDPHRRGHRAGRHDAASAAAGVSRQSRPAMRLLHAGHADDADRVPARQSGPDRSTRCAIAISGNLCRCTGYQNIVAAALDAAKRLPPKAASDPQLGLSATLSPRSQAAGMTVMPVCASTISATGSRRFASAPGSRRTRSRSGSAFRAPRSTASRRARWRRSRRWRSSPSCSASRCRRCSASASNTSRRRSAYFERMRQIEETAEHIIVLAGPDLLSARLRRLRSRARRGPARERCPTASPTAQARARADRRAHERCCASARRAIAGASPASSI